MDEGPRAGSGARGAGDAPLHDVFRLAGAPGLLREPQRLVGLFAEDEVCRALELPRALPRGVLLARGGQQLRLHALERHRHLLLRPPLRGGLELPQVPRQALLQDRALRSLRRLGRRGGGLLDVHLRPVVGPPQQPHRLRRARPRRPRRRCAGAVAGLMVDGGAVAGGGDGVGGDRLLRRPHHGGDGAHPRRPLRGGAHRRRGRGAGVLSHHAAAPARGARDRGEHPHDRGPEAVRPHLGDDARLQLHAHHGDVYVRRRLRAAHDEFSHGLRHVDDGRALLPRGPFTFTFNRVMRRAEVEY